MFCILDFSAADLIDSELLYLVTQRVHTSLFPPNISTSHCGKVRCSLILNTLLTIRVSEGTFSDLISNAENELDFPQFSASTGFAENNPLVHSIYQRFVERNRCNRNDYQNLGVNGNKSNSSLKYMIFCYLIAGARVGAFDNIKAVRRNQATDHPLLVVFEFVGNDVCNGHPTLSAQTTPENFR